MGSTHPPGPALVTASADADPVTLLVLGWLAAKRSENTRTAYARDIGITPQRRASRAPSWLAWCQEQGVHPVTGVTGLHVARYARQLDAAGFGDDLGYAGCVREDARDTRPFAYHRPTSVQEAVGLLAKLGDDGRPLAGGHSLIPMMKLRLATPANLVDLAGIAELKGIRADGNDIVIGAMTTQHELIGSELLARARSRSCAKLRSKSPIRKCAISARSAAMSPMAIRATTCRR